jgi:integrase
MSANLREARVLYIAYRTASGRKPATILKDDQCLTALIHFYGDIPLDDIQIDRFFTARSFLSASYRNSHLSVFRGFFEFCRKRGLMSERDIMWGYEHTANPPAEKKYIPVDDFPTLIESAENSRDRMIIALGLYLFVRQGEITGIRVGDVSGTHIGVRIWKTNQFDRMQINLELGLELSRWLSSYTRQVGAPLHPSWPLVPVLSPSWGRLVPDQSRPLQRPYRATQRALARMGWTDTEIDGEGGHLLRRSGARAMYFSLRDREGNERAMAFVQRRLHHAKRAQTEAYIGVTADQKEMDDLLVHRPMFATPDRENVIQFRRRT